MKVIISGHFDKKVRLWDNRSSSSEPMNELVVGGKVTSLDLSKDMNLLAVCSRYKLNTSVEIQQFFNYVYFVSKCTFHISSGTTR